MSEPIVSVEGLGKKFTLSSADPGRGLRHVIQDAMTAPWRWMANSSKRNGQPAAEDFWALQDVTFSVAPGEVVGIVGRNGAGKSTLLKLLSRITDPTTGSITLRGRVASLLEVGTGFHPELSGRENIFLNGAILGMSRREITKKFDAMVDFAELERFLDTPVKRYSSGMYMRLAFSVAAHLEPEILIVDEVLAVGDAAFQQKCLGKMDQVARQEGRTVLFVSHNLAAVQKLCRSAKLLDQGRLKAEGTPGEIIRRYLDLSAGAAASSGAGLGGDCKAELVVTDEAGRTTRTWRYGEPLRFKVIIRSTRTLQRPAVDLSFYDERRVRLCVLQSDRLQSGPAAIDGVWTADFTVQNPGWIMPELTVDVGIREGAGAYLTLLVDAARLCPDFATVPSAAMNDGLLFPPTTHGWTREPDNMPAAHAA